MKKTISAVLAVAAVGLTIVLGTEIAQAATLVTYQSAGVIRTGTQAGPGKTLYSKDYAADGYGSRSPYRTSSSVTGTFDNSNGANTTTSVPIVGAGTVYFKACIKNGSTTIGCSLEESDTF